MSQNIYHLIVLILAAQAIATLLALACTRHELNDLRSNLSRFWFVSEVIDDGTLFYTCLPGHVPPPYRRRGGSVDAAIIATPDRIPPDITVTTRRGSQPSGIKFGRGSKSE